MTAPLLVAREERGSELTFDREERKYAIDRAALPRFLRVVSARLPLHRFTGEGANKLPDARSFVTTVYYDTPSHRQLATALESYEHNVKVRAREYYDVHPSLAELATDPSQIVRYQPWVWFEIKRRDAGRSQKQRFRLLKRDVSAFFRGELTASHFPEHASEDFFSIVAYCCALEEALVPSCIVNYQRFAFQSPDDVLRLTVDLDVAYYPAPADLWDRSTALVRGTFGPPREVERRALVEVKSRTELPAWLAELLLETKLDSISFSKFVRAGTAVHGL